MSERRFEYEMKNYGGSDSTWRPKVDYETLEGAIEDMAAGGWRYVGCTDGVAVFERPLGG